MQTAWIRDLAGRFLVFDGPDGSGKSTQFARFVELCAAEDVVVREVREPGGTSIGEQIRKILLHPENTEMALRCEMMLYMASRAQLVEQIIKPALHRKELVLADRFISSTLAYQGTAGGLDAGEILRVGAVAVGSHWPDLTVIFDVDERTAARRLTGKARGRADEPTLFSDRMERKGREFRERVRRGYLDQAEADPAKYLVVNGAGEPDAVFERLCEGLAERRADWR